MPLDTIPALTVTSSDTWRVLLVMLAVAAGCSGTGMGDPPGDNADVDQHAAATTDTNATDPS